METNLNYSSFTKFITSFGMLLMIASFSFIVYVTIKNIFNFLLYVYSVIFLLAGGFLVIIGAARLEKLEIAEIRYKQEQTVREILEQDLLLSKIKLAYLDYNNKIQETNKNLQDNLKKPLLEPRGMDSVIRQALNPSAYEDITGKTKKSFWKNLFETN